MICWSVKLVWSFIVVIVNIGHQIRLLCVMMGSNKKGLKLLYTAYKVTIPSQYVVTLVEKLKWTCSRLFSMSRHQSLMSRHWTLRSRPQTNVVWKIYILVHIVMIIKTLQMMKQRLQISSRGYNNQPTRLW